MKFRLRLLEGSQPTVVLESLMAAGWSDLLPQHLAHSAAVMEASFGQGWQPSLWSGVQKPQGSLIPGTQEGCQMLPCLLIVTAQSLSCFSNLLVLRLLTLLKMLEDPQRAFVYMCFISVKIIILEINTDTF